MRFSVVIPSTPNSPFQSWIWVLGLGVTLLACQPKTLPQPIEDEPDFFIQGDVDGMSLDLKAGVEDYYMHTRFVHEQTGVFAFQGFLSPSNCLDCPHSLMIEIRDKVVRPDNNDPGILDALKPGNYVFANSVTSPESFSRVRFFNQSTGSGAFNYHWFLGNGVEKFLENPVYDYDPSLSEVEVCLAAESAGPCATEICNLVSLDPNACRADFSFSVDSGTSYVRFTSEVQGAQPIQYSWDFGDGFGATLGNPGYSYNSYDRFQVSLTASDANGCEATMSKFVSTDPAQCVHNFSYKVETVAPLDTLMLGMIRVSWRDDAGTLFRSDWTDQTGENYFQIEELQDYQNNELDQATRRLKVRLDCMLSNGTETIRLREANGYWGVAVPL